MAKMVNGTASPGPLLLLNSPDRWMDGWMDRWKDRANFFSPLFSSKMWGEGAKYRKNKGAYLPMIFL